MNDKANRPASGIGSHALTISMGVKLLGENQVAVTIFEGGRFEHSVILALAVEALKAAPETAFDKWTGGSIWRSSPYPDGRPDHTITVQFIKIQGVVA